MRPDFRLLTLASLLVSTGSAAQLSVNASGGNASGTGGTVTYSIGQVDHIAIASASGTANLGVQQPYEFLVLEVEEGRTDAMMNCYPNPTSGHLVLDAASFSEDLRYALYDPQGRVVMTDRITGPQTIIPTSSLPAATYLLQVTTKDGAPAKTYEVIKIN